MEVKAKLRYLRISPKKVRLVVDVIRGLNVIDAQNQLKFMAKAAAKPILKLLSSAVANAEHNFDLKKDNLYIQEIRVDEGPTLKRSIPRAMGRATAIRKRSSHVILALAEKKNNKDVVEKNEQELPVSKKKSVAKTKIAKKDETIKKETKKVKK